MPLPEKLKSVFRTLGLMRAPAIETFPQLSEYIEKNSAFVSQTTLYTYVKARAGTQWPKLFEHPDFLTSLKIARWHIFGAAVSDMSLFAAAQPFTAGLLTRESTQTFAEDLLQAVLADYQQDDIDPASFAEMLESGRRRAAFADWATIADGPAAFQTSSDAVYHWAPIADELKALDEDIVRNSIHLRWIGVRRDTKALMRPAMIVDSWRRSP